MNSDLFILIWESITFNHYHTVQMFHPHTSYTIIKDKTNIFCLYCCYISFSSEFFAVCWQWGMTDIFPLLLIVFASEEGLHSKELVTFETLQFKSVEYEMHTQLYYHIWKNNQYRSWLCWITYSLCVCARACAHMAYSVSSQTGFFALVQSVVTTPAASGIIPKVWWASELKANFCAHCLWHYSRSNQEVQHALCDYRDVGFPW
jgi:hypothetical protein